MSARFDAIVKREKAVYAPTARRWPLALVRGLGSRVWDADGTEYVDLTAGWGVTCLGHCHPLLVEAITEQSKTLMQTTNIVFSTPQLDLAEHLDRRMPDPIHKSFFVSSGAEANEGALKLAAAATGRSEFVATLGSFHGRTLGALGVLGQEKHRARWSGLIREAAFVPYGDADAAKAAIDARVAAMIVEPLQGEGGVNPAPDGYLAELLELCHAAGALLIVDEIQTGVGRTGRWFGFEHSGIVPDITTLGKGLGGGMPIAAFLATDAVMDTMQPGDHGGTYAGNLVTCRAAKAVLDVIEAEQLVERAARLGAHVARRLGAIATRAGERAAGVRGLGLLQGLVFTSDELAARVHAACLEAGVLTSLTAGTVIRLFPALNIPEDDLDRGIDLLAEVVERI
jgi:acetylornithine/succinyldiaminopimelate/putrescine aminotransferase